MVRPRLWTPCTSLLAFLSSSSASCSSRHPRQGAGSVVGGTLAIALAGAYYLLWVVPQSDKTRELTKLASLSSIPLKGALDCTNAWDGKPRTISYDVSEGRATTFTEGGESEDTVTIDADRALHFSLGGVFEDTISSDGVLVSRGTLGHEDNGPDGKPRVLAR
jgi:hypothetical protein